MLLFWSMLSPSWDWDEEAAGGAKAPFGGFPSWLSIMDAASPRPPRRQIGCLYPFKRPRVGNQTFLVGDRRNGSWLENRRKLCRYADMTSISTFMSIHLFSPPNYLNFDDATVELWLACWWYNQPPLSAMQTHFVFVHFVFLCFCWIFCSYILVSHLMGRILPTHWNHILSKKK